MREASGLREVNLEAGLPTVEQALVQLRQELRTSRELRYGAVKFIHGYGSTGKGGKIRKAVRRELGVMLGKRELRLVIYGECFTIFDASTREAFLHCPALRQERDLERYNNGVTFVVF